MGAESALVFSTGYQTNLGVISTLVGRGDHLFLDKLNHASIVDGARAGLRHRAPLRAQRHGGARAAARSGTPTKARKLIVTDGVFSMEGDIADLPPCWRWPSATARALMVDDAHSVGVLGADGGGTATHFGVTGRGAT